MPPTKSTHPDDLRLKSFIKIARRLGALRVKVGDIEVELDPRVIQLPQAKSATPEAPVTTEKEPSTEELMYHSAPDIFVPEQPK